VCIHRTIIVNRSLLLCRSIVSEYRKALHIIRRLAVPPDMYTIILWDVYLYTMGCIVYKLDLYLYTIGVHFTLFYASGG
jgi:hypothetical protein